MVESGISLLKKEGNFLDSNELTEDEILESELSLLSKVGNIFIHFSN